MEANSPRDSEVVFNRQTIACASSSISIASKLGAIDEYDMVTRAIFEKL